MNEELQKLYEAARRAKEHDDRKAAVWYYDRILTRDPLSWEAHFYTAYFRVRRDSIEAVIHSVEAIKGRLSSTLYLIKNHVGEEAERLQATREVGVCCARAAVLLFRTAAENFPEEVNRYRAYLMGDLLYNLRYEIWHTFNGSSLYETILNDYKTSAEISAGFRFFGIEIDYAMVKLPPQMLFYDLDRG